MRQVLFVFACILFLAQVKSAVSADKPTVTPSQNATPARKLITQAKVLIIAHRGNSGEAPENTLPAFASAVKAGADLVELDYYHAADGAAVVFHDKTLDRTTNAAQVFGRNKITITSLAWPELSRLDAGSWFGENYRNVKIPTLEQALEVIQRGSTTLIERKGGDAPACISLLQKNNLLDQVVVQSFDWDFLAECRRLAPDLALGALGTDKLTENKLAAIKALRVDVIGWNHKYIDASDIAAIHEQGMKAWVYTVNDQRRVKELTSVGIDGIITDFPAKMKKLADHK